MHSESGEGYLTSLEILINDTGGCGIFQLVLLLAVSCTTIPISWANMFMAYGNYDPGWICLDNETNSNGSRDYLTYNEPMTGMNETVEDSSSCDIFKSCQNIHFEKGISTIVTEWRLSCDLSWIPSIIISLQMTGMLVGAYTGGHLCDKIGRKRMLYGVIFIHGLLTLVAAYSVNWQMFAVIKLLLGALCGASVSTTYLYAIEFINIRWRMVISCLPVMSIANITFSISALLVKDWRELHIMMTVVAFVTCLGVLWSPESMRWQATRGKVEQASQVACKIARTNRRPIPDTTILNVIAQNEIMHLKNKIREYSYRDLFRRGLYKRTLIMSFTWFSMVMTFYAIGFGIKALSGNFFVNLILFSIINCVLYPFIPFLSNKTGRRPGILFFYSLACACCFSIVLIHFLASEDLKGISTVVLALITFCAIDASWCIVVIYNLELYPTVIRGLGYGFASAVSRLGGIVAPYLIPNNPDTLYVTYSVFGFVILVNGLLLLTLPETRKDPLEDTFRHGETTSNGEQSSKVASAFVATDEEAL